MTSEERKRAPFTAPSLLFATLKSEVCSLAYSCAGSGSIVFGITGTCTSSRYGDVIRKTRMRGKASMNDEVAEAPRAEVAEEDADLPDAERREVTVSP